MNLLFLWDSFLTMSAGFTVWKNVGFVKGECSEKKQTISCQVCGTSFF